MNDSLSERYASSLLYGGNGSYLEALYEQYLRDPGSVAPEWRTYFDRIRAGAGAETAHGPIIEALRQRARQGVATDRDQLHAATAKQGAVSRLIQMYANRGHLIANLDPLGLTERAKSPSARSRILRSLERATWTPSSSPAAATAPSRPSRSSRISWRT